MQVARTQLTHVDRCNVRRALSQREYVHARILTVGQAELGRFLDGLTKNNLGTDR